MDDLILSVVKDRGWSDLDCYAISLARCGYSGKKMMFVENVPQDAQDNLKALGFEVIPFTTPEEYRHLHFQSYRYHLASRVDLSPYCYVLWTDVCDLVFQTNPQERFHGNLIAAEEGWLIKNQPINKIWLERFLSPEYCEEMGEREVLCSGTIAGKSAAMKVLLQAMWEWCKKYGEMQGIDQGIFNWLSRTFSNSLCVPETSEGFICTCGPFLAPCDPKLWTIEPPYFDFDSGLVYTNDGSKLFSIVHQYNRAYGPLDPSGIFRGAVERRYRG